MASPLRESGQRRGASDGDLLALLDRGWEEARHRAGGGLACEPGCDNCCLGPFPITRLDVRRLRRGLRALRRRDVGRAADVQSRAEAALEQLRDGFPGDPLGGRLTPDEGRLDVYFAAHAGLACPALDRGTGRCDLYDDRPVACRTYGPPLRFGEQAASHCRLCFRGASAAQVERARWEPDPRGLERSLLDAAGAPPDEHWFTLIAFALAPQAGSAMERSIDG